MAAGKKMDIFELQRMGIENGEIDATDFNDFREKLAVLKFEKAPEDTCAKSKFMNKLVLPNDTDAFGNGYYICRLNRNNNYYQADLVHPLDASFLLNLLKDDRDKITSALWEAHKEDVLTYMEEIGNMRIAELVEKKASEKTEEMNRENADLREQLAKAAEDNDELQNQLQEKIDMIELLRNQRPPAHEEQEAVPFDRAVRDVYTVRRTGPYTISSDWFIASKYFVHVSRDGKRMIIRPHDYGTISSSMCSLSLPGLESLSPFTEECVMSSEYDPNDDSITVNL